MTDRGPEPGDGGQAGGDEPPNPFSREGSGGETWPAYPSSTPPPDPSTPPPANPYATPYADPGFDPQPTPPYVPYGDSRPYDLTPPAAYGSNPYEVSPYQPGYGGYGPYGMVPTQHPRSVTAMVLGIIGIVLAASCGIGGFVGIAGIVIGRKAREEIDAEPGRYSGRSQASAGIVTGTIATVLAALLTILFIFIIVGTGLEGF